MLTPKLIVSVIEFISTLNGSSIDNTEQNGLEKIKASVPWHEW